MSHHYRAQTMAVKEPLNMRASPCGQGRALERLRGLLSPLCLESKNCGFKEGLCRNAVFAGSRQMKEVFELWKTY